jgi:hypothetical protein
MAEGSLAREKLQRVLKSSRKLAIGYMRGNLVIQLHQEDPVRSQRTIADYLESFENPTKHDFLGRALNGIEPPRSYFVRYVSKLGLGPIEYIVKGMVEDLAPDFNWEL